jgi:FtsZ-binding cell division protein ZapB
LLNELAQEKKEKKSVQEQLTTKFQAVKKEAKRWKRKANNGY